MNNQAFKVGQRAMTQYGWGEILRINGDLAQVQVGKHIFGIPLRYLAKETFMDFLIRPDGMGRTPWSIVGVFQLIAAICGLAVYYSQDDPSIPLSIAATAIIELVLISTVILDWKKYNEN